jgi:chaperone required for assembly of F1-ATPase
MKGVKGEIDQRPRRFYSSVGAEPSAGGWSVRLDGRPILTPERRELILPSQPLAAAVAAEWDGQEDRIDLQSMFATRLANVALDRTPGAREQLAAEAARYAQTDLLCHLAEAPMALRDRQEAAFAPLRAWAGDTLGVRLIPVLGLMPGDQPEASLERVRAHAAGLDDFRLTGLIYAVGLFGSAILGLATERGRTHALEAHDLAWLDETFQASQWGEDDLARLRRERSRSEAQAIGVWFSALGSV